MNKMKKRKLNLPPYLTKLKIRELRTKIIMRKCAYIWLIKTTHSSVLPSQARRIHSKHVLKKHFQKLKMVWYYQRVEVRLLLRANIHYRYNLKQKTLKSWRLYLLWRTEKRIKTEIAIAHCNRSIKKKYFLKLRIVKESFKLMEILQKYWLYSILHVNLVRWDQIRVKQGRKHILEMLYNDFFRKRMLPKCFTKLQQNREAELKKKSDLVKADKHFRSKHPAEEIEVFFSFWKVFAKRSALIRNKINLASTHYETKIKHKSFKQFCCYTKKRRVKKLLFEKSRKFYLNKLFEAWKSYTKISFKKKLDLEKASLFLAHKLCLRYFEKLRVYAARKKELKTKQNILSNLVENKIKTACFNKLERYSKYRIKRKFRLNIASEYYFKKLKKGCLRKLNNYTKESISNFLKIHFLSWRVYVLVRLEKKLKIKAAESRYKTQTLKTLLRAWKEITDQWKSKKLRFKSSTKYYETKLLRICLKSFLKNVEDEKWYKESIQRAREVHVKTLQQEGVRMIFEIGIKMQEEREGFALEKMERHFCISKKYFGIWKRKAIGVHELEFMNSCGANKTKTLEVIPEECLELFDFEWDPLCFEQPRVPSFIRDLNCL